MKRSAARYLRGALALVAAAIVVAATGLVVFWGYRVGSLQFRVVRADPPPGDFTPREAPKLSGSADEIERLRADALARAQVWSPPVRPIGEVDFSRNVDPAFSPADDVSCEYLFDDSHGWSPKFDCVLAGGEVVRVKYGRGNGEVFAEAAATRLLSALGFGADRVSVVRSVRCFGCPPYPYPRWGAFWNGLLRAQGGYRTYEPAIVERRLEGTALVHHGARGWSWDELDRLDPARGGASSLQKDALRLTAVFLAHWDHKPENQRLLCLEAPKAAGDGCRRPWAFIQDAGSTFGPRCADLQRWRAAPLWSDAGRCRLHMARVPHEGSGFADVEIGEGARRFVAERLGAISRAQLRALFSASRFERRAFASTGSQDPEAWADVFTARVAEIAAGGPCPLP
jgi:hypothetical protein